MKKQSYFLAGLLLFCFLSPSVAQDIKFPILKGEYLDQKPPGMKPELFGSGIVSTGFYERDTAITPDGKYFLFSSSRVKEGLETIKDTLTLGKTKNFDTMPQKGRSDIYWVGAKVVASLKPSD